MVVSKRCKICTTLQPENIPIFGDFFGKDIPQVIEGICGIELDERKSNGVLICIHCVTELMFTGEFITKLKSSVERLKKPLKSKTPSKETPRKTSGQAAKIVKNLVVNSPVDVETTNGESKIHTMHDTLMEEDKIEKKTPKKVVRRKSVFQDDKNIGALEVEANSKNSLSEKKKSKKSPNSLFGSDEDEDKANVETNADSTATAEIKNTVSKRKQELLEDALSPNNTDNDDVNDKAEKNHKKRSKKASLSFGDQSLMDLTTGVQETKKKILNCVICGKSFNQKSTLRDHIDALHMGERLKECPHCSTEFRSQQKYESHVFNEKCQTSLHACQYPKCNKRFKTVHKMELHMHEKHSSQNGSDSD